VETGKEIIYDNSDDRARALELASIPENEWEIWEGRELLYLHQADLIRIAMGGLMYIVHSFEPRTSWSYFAVTERFLGRKQRLREYDGTIIPSFFQMKRITGSSGLDIYYCRLEAGKDNVDCVPGAQEIAIRRYDPEPAQ
jgi:hypothetical protein